MLGTLKCGENGNYIFTEHGGTEEYVLPSSELALQKRMGKKSIEKIMDNCEVVVIDEASRTVSRAEMQRRYVETFKSRIGEVIEGTILYGDAMSVFVDLGHGVYGRIIGKDCGHAWIPTIDAVLEIGWYIKAVVKEVVDDKIGLTITPLLGTFKENVARVESHQPFQKRLVSVIDRNIAYIMINPNLVGVTHKLPPDVKEGDYVDLVTLTTFSEDYKNIPVVVIGKSEKGELEPLQYIIHEGMNYSNWRYFERENE